MYVYDSERTILSWSHKRTCYSDMWLPRGYAAVKLKSMFDTLCSTKLNLSVIFFYRKDSDLLYGD